MSASGKSVYSYWTGWLTERGYVMRRMFFGPSAKKEAIADASARRVSAHAAWCPDGKPAFETCEIELEEIYTP